MNTYQSQKCPISVSGPNNKPFCQVSHFFSAIARRKYVGLQLNQAISDKQALLKGAFQIRFIAEG